MGKKTNTCGPDTLEVGVVTPREFYDLCRAQPCLPKPSGLDEMIKYRFKLGPYDGFAEIKDGFYQTVYMEEGPVGAKMFAKLISSKRSLVVYEWTNEPTPEQITKLRLYS